MRRFAALCEALDASRDAAERQALVQRYLAAAPPADAAWAVQLLAGGRPRPLLSRTVLRQAAGAAAGIDDWLFDACLAATGDLAETVAHLLPTPPHNDQNEGFSSDRIDGLADSAHNLAQGLNDRLLPLHGHELAERAVLLCQALADLLPAERQLLLQLALGSFKTSLARPELQQVLATLAGPDGPDAATIAQRLGDQGWGGPRAPVHADGLQRLLAPVNPQSAQARPLRFSPWVPWAGDADPLAGDAHGWAAWAYGGLRAQLQRQGGRTRLWSQQDELLDGRLPEIVAAAQALPDGLVLEGELLVWPADAPRPAPAGDLVRRLGLKAVTRQRQTAQPAVFVVHDLLALPGVSLNDTTLAQRQAWLDGLPLQAPTLRRLRWQAVGGDGIEGPDDAAFGRRAPASTLATRRLAARAQGALGLLWLPHAGHTAGTTGLVGGTGAAGRAGSAERPPVWFWPAPPLSVPGVLIYVQTDEARSGAAFDAYSLAVWNRPPQDADEAQAVVQAIAERRPATAGALQLLPLTKAVSALNHDDQARLQQHVREHTLQRFGPVRSLRPTLVVDLAFDGLHRSARHKSGLVLLQPRLLRLRSDLAPHQAGHLAQLQAWLPDDYS